MKYDHSKLRGRIIEKYGTVRAICKELETTETAMSNKLNNRHAFRVNDIERLINLLYIDRSKIGEYFFTPQK